MNTPTPNTPSTSRGGGKPPMSGIRTVGPNELFAKSAPNPTRRTNMVSRIRQDKSNDGETEEPLGFDRLILGKKTVVAEPGEDGRKKYIEDTKRFLRTKNVPFLTKMAKDEKVKAKSNRKEDLVEALAKARVVIAYGKQRDAAPVRISEQVNPEAQGNEDDE
ncbi:hypothetical protein CBR_g26050 [Chara braunii]|uniref:Uncharacterized protein n=1 Tax=Chara braunii TaxID=69332 RepID=A0A388L7D4_CHABU|nr:hypothetical protein CBR_g26050 [Chara braunii]|eukprot:GBG78113.1 hypothetical protein CBR_g26050 [Chara braunii]